MAYTYEQSECSISSTKDSCSCAEISPECICVCESECWLGVILWSQIFHMLIIPRILLIYDVITLYA